MQYYRINGVLSFLSALWEIAIYINRFVGVPAAVWTVVMELLGWQYLQKSKVPKTLVYILIGVFLGSLSAFWKAMPVLFARCSGMGFFISLGAFTGLIVSSIKAKLHLIERRQRLSTTVDTV